MEHSSEGNDKIHTKDREWSTLSVKGGGRWHADIKMQREPIDNRVRGAEELQPRLLCT